MKICILSVSTTALNILAFVIKQHAWIRGSLELCCFYAGNDSLTGKALTESLDTAKASDLVILDLMGVHHQVQQAIGEELQGFTGPVIVTNSDKTSVRRLTRLGKFSLAGMSKTGNKGSQRTDSWQGQMKNARQIMAMAEKAGTALPVGPLRDMRNYFWAAKYWRYADEHNMYNLLCLLANEYGNVSGIPAYKPPREVEDATILDPRETKSFRSYGAWVRNREVDTSLPMTVVLYNSGRYPVDTHGAVRALMEKMESSCTVVPVAINRITTDNVKKLRKLLPKNLDCVVNLLAFRLGQGPMGGNAEEAIDLLRELNVPVLHPFFITRRSIEQWHNDPHGTQPSEFLISIFLPELDGCIETIPIGAINPEQDSWGGLDLLGERVDKVISRIQRWRTLRHKPNKDKRIAIVMYNYPPGEGGIGAGAFIDALSSVEAITRELQTRGYNVEPLTREQVCRHFDEEGNCNCPQWRAPASGVSMAEERYVKATETAVWAKRIEDYWGPFPGRVMAGNDGVAIPCIKIGNVILGLQPPRSAGVVSARDYHDPHKPPHHQYAAFYRWLECEFKADAVIHVGTHGTLEFLPGKENALSGDCFPDALIGSMPHLYCYYSGNPSESSIAKRRSHAVMISHLQPPFVTGGVYGELQQLGTLLDEHSQAADLNPTRVKEIESDIAGLVSQLGWKCETTGDVAFKLGEIKRSFVPGRLHTFGQAFSHQEAIDFLWQFSQCWHGDGKGLAEEVAEKRKWKWEELREKPERYAHEIEIVEQACRAGIASIVATGAKPKGPVEKRLCQLYRHLVNNDELASLCTALEGGYIPVGLGGDVFRNPEVLPSGRNLYQFDPRSVPSPSATRMGILMAQNLVEEYHKANGTWPKSIAVVLWGLETSKTNGETIAQILHLLGVRLNRANPWEKKLEIIPLSELGRPRVDVTVQMSGFLRDLFPNIIELIQDALELVGRQAEEGGANPIRAHAEELHARLVDMGYNEEDSRELSFARVFGPDAAAYGTAVTGLVKSKEWQKENELVDAYTHSLRFVYTRRFYGKEMKNLLTRNLAKVEVVSQVRSSMDYEVTDLDHYYEFLGGLARTVKEHSGKKAMILVNDSHEGRARTETVRHSIQRGIRSRLLNPRWQDGMLSHDYHGAQQFAEKLENLVGLAATTEEVDNALFQDAARDLILNENLRKRLQENNPHALREIMERLFEANLRGYWETDEDTLEEMRRLYLQLEGNIEGKHVTA